MLASQDHWVENWRLIPSGNFESLCRTRTVIPTEGVGLEHLHTISLQSVTG